MNRVTLKLKRLDRIKKFIDEQPSEGKLETNQPFGIYNCLTIFNLKKSILNGIDTFFLVGVPQVKTIIKKISTY